MLFVFEKRKYDMIVPLFAHEEDLPIKLFRLQLSPPIPRRED